MVWNERVSLICYTTISTKEQTKKKSMRGGEEDLVYRVMYMYREKKEKKIGLSL